MSCWRVLLCVVFPPLAVLDKGCGAVSITLVLTVIGWVPGVIAALVFNTREPAD
ncbi:YqaE/Pmp3 family membrane protein [Chloroflexota bacterium]